jgi:hypothetical protein
MRRISRRATRARPLITVFVFAAIALVEAAGRRWNA